MTVVEQVMPKRRSEVEGVLLVVKANKLKTAGLLMKESLVMSEKQKKKRKERSM